MASITLPTTAKGPSSGPRESGTAGATLAQGQFVYRDSTTRRFTLAQANSALTSDVVGMMEQSVTVDSPCSVVTDGIVTGLSGITVGETYVLSSTVAGGIMPIGDLGSGDRVVHIGIGLSSSSLRLNILNPVVGKP